MATQTSLFTWALPGLVFAVSFGFAACSDAMSTAGTCGAGGSEPGVTSSTASGGVHDAGGDSGGPEQAPGGTFTSSQDPNNTFDHFNDPGASGSKDPFEILKERAEEGPPEVRTRLHSCTKVAYASLGAFLTSRGVNMASSAANSAGLLYKTGGDAMGVAKFSAREGEAYFHTTAAATKLFDIFVQAAPEVIANIATQDACKVNGIGKPMFDGVTGKCVYESLSCIMGRPATADDLAVCDLMLEQAAPGNMADLTIKRNITVAAFLSAAHTCE